MGKVCDTFAGPPGHPNSPPPDPPETNRITPMRRGNDTPDPAGFTFHDDRDHYHAHVVALQGHDGRWLNPKKNDLLAWR
jgi:hypothetical protein